MAVDHLAGEGAQLREHGRVGADHAREVHHLGEPQHPGARLERGEVDRVERGARALHVGRRHAGGGHHEHRHRRALGALEHEADALEPEHVGDLVRVGDHRRRAARHHRARELRRRHHGALDVDVGVEQTRGQVGAAEVDVARRVGADADDAAGDRDLGRVDLAGEDVDQLEVGEQELGGLGAAGVTSEMCEFHAMTPGGVRLERQRQVYAARSGFGDRKDVGNAEAVVIDVDGMHGQRS